MTCSRCGREGRTVQPYWDPGTALCSTCCQALALTFDDALEWPPLTPELFIPEAWL